MYHTPPYLYLQDYIEFKVTGTGNYMIGVVSGTVSQNSYAGQFANGCVRQWPLFSPLLLLFVADLELLPLHRWTYYSPGQLYHNNSTPHTGQSYTMGDRIGVAVDFENSKFLFYKNGTGQLVPSSFLPHHTDTVPLSNGFVTQLSMLLQTNCPSR